MFTPFKCLFAPTFRIPMSKLVRFSESLGKTYGKEGSQIWILLLLKGVKLLPKKKVLFSINFALLAGFFGIGPTIRINREILCLPYAGFLYVSLTRFLCIAYLTFILLDLLLLREYILANTKNIFTYIWIYIWNVNFESGQIVNSEFTLCSKRPADETSWSADETSKSVDVLVLVYLKVLILC